MRYCPNCGHLNRMNHRCQSGDNAGDFGVDIGSGDLTMGIGGGLAIDLETGDLELEVAPGIDIDLDGNGW